MISSRALGQNKLCSYQKLQEYHELLNFRHRWGLRDNLAQTFHFLDKEVESRGERKERGQDHVADSGSFYWKHLHSRVKDYQLFF